jgi:hypothetical protein
VHEGAILNEMVNRLEVRDAELEITEPLRHPTVPLEGSLDGRADGQALTFTTDIKSGIYVVGRDEITLDGHGVCLKLKARMLLQRMSPPIIGGRYRCKA